MENTNKFYKKYLKYKSKYLQLKKISKGGAEINRCTNFSNSFYQIDDIYTYFDDFFPRGGLEEGFTLPNRTVPAEFDINFDIDSVSEDIASDINSISFNYLYQPRPVRPRVGAGAGAGAIVIPEKIIKNYVLDLVNIPREVIKVYTHDESDFVSVNKIGMRENYYPENFILPTSIIGKNFGLKCDDIVDNFINIISGINAPQGIPRKKIIFMDFVNVASTLATSMTGRRATFVKEYLNFYIYKQCKIEENYIFIIYKPSTTYDFDFITDVLAGPSTQPYLNLTELLNEPGIPRLNIICCGFASSISSDLPKIPALGFGRDNWEPGNKQLYHGLIISSVDDMIFWLFTVFTYNLIIKRNPAFSMDNFLIITNDVQALDTNDCQYYNDVTLLNNIPRDCRSPENRRGAPILPKKNIFDINFPNKCDLDYINSEYEIFLYSFKFATERLSVDGKIILENTFYKTYDTLLNRYVNFFYNLFANTPVKLQSNLDIKYNLSDRINVVVKIKDYRANNRLCLIPTKKLAARFENTPSNKWNNLDTYVAIFEKLLLNNIPLSSFRTDAVYFLFRNYPWEYLDNINQTEGGGPHAHRNLIEYINIPNSRLLDSDKLKFIHPGLFFYYQIKFIQSIKYGPPPSPQSLSHDNIIAIFGFNNTFSQDYVDFMERFINQIKTIQNSLIIQNQELLKKLSAQARAGPTPSPVPASPPVSAPGSAPASVPGTVPASPPVSAPGTVPASPPGSVPGSVLRPVLPPSPVSAPSPVSFGSLGVDQRVLAPSPVTLSSPPIRPRPATLPQGIAGVSAASATVQDSQSKSAFVSTASLSSPGSVSSPGSPPITAPSQRPPPSPVAASNPVVASSQRPPPSPVATSSPVAPPSKGKGRKK